MKVHSFAILIALLIASLAGSRLSSAAGPYSVLHSFSGEINGAEAGLAGSNSVLYGSLRDSGTIFRINEDGTNFVTLQTPYDDGLQPIGDLTLSGSVLFGAALAVGGGGGGAVFKMNTNGTGFQSVHYFSSPSDGQIPDAGVVVSGSAVYGTTALGGPNGGGTVFKVNTDGTGFTMLHSFSQTNGTSAEPGGLVISGSTLYGVIGGNSGDMGSVFRMNLDGTGYSVLHAFGAGDGRNPAYLHSLAVSGNTLFGTTQAGGQNGTGAGSVFRINIDGTGYNILHTLSPSEGIFPVYGVTLIGSALYGTGFVGGQNNNGSLFRLNTDGTGFAVLHLFAGGAADGANPQSELAFTDSSVFGITSGGGLSNDGVLFAFAVPEPSTFVLGIAGVAGAGFVTLRKRFRRF